MTAGDTPGRDSGNGPFDDDLDPDTPRFAPGDDSDRGVSWHESPVTPGRPQADGFDNDGEGLVDDPGERAFEPDPDWDADKTPVEQLPLGDDDDAALPWLEGDAGEDEYEGYSTGHILGLVLLGLVIMALVVGGIWYASRAGRADETIVADGSTIEAPDAPYKERPEDPGGKTFEGTGDTSFAVSQGQSRPVRIGGETAAPGFETVDAANAPATGVVPAASAAAGATAPAAAGIGVQVGAYSTREAAEAGWTTLAGRTPALSGVKHRVVEGQADIGKVFRLQAVAPDTAAAKALCGKLKAAGTSCQVKN